MLAELRQAIPGQHRPHYGAELETEIEHLVNLIAQYSAVAEAYPVRWLAIKLLEQDRPLQEALLTVAGGPAVLTQAQLSYARLNEQLGDDVALTIADQRYNWVHEVISTAVVETSDGLTASDKLDRLVTHRLWGVPIFMAVMWVVFKITADVSAPLLDWVDGVIGGPITHWAAWLLQAAGLAETWVASLVLDGAIAGVGGVLVFVPVLIFLYVTLAVLEETGYMARAAFVMDNLMGKIGLQGKSFLPMMVGFGCTVPAIYATRTLENEKDRLLTGLLVPFMSCGARLPVYILFAAVFFPGYAGGVVFGLYLLGILTAVVVGLVLSRTLFRGGENTAMIMELPPYQWPNWRTVVGYSWERVTDFVRNAWTLILGTSIVLWFLMAIPLGPTAGTFGQTELEQSLFGQLAGQTSRLFEPLGFGSWEATGALVTGFVAKEVVVSTIAQTYGVAEADEAAMEPAPTLAEDVWFIGTSLVTAVGDTARAVPLIVGIDLQGEDDTAVESDLRRAVAAGFDASSGGYGALAALSFMVFVLIYTPCMVAVAAEKQEFGTRWMWRSVIGQFVLAWLMSFVIFQGGKLLLAGLG